MKNEKWIIPLAAGVGAAAIVYALWPKNKIPDDAVEQLLDLDKYMGDWNEIARMPNILEKGITKLIEQYEPIDGRSFKVTTKAYKAETNKWSAFEGKAKFAGPEDSGRLKVSYFGPVYFDYNVLDIDTGYNYALVSGSSLDYLWILSKESTVPDDIKERFLTKAKEIGFMIEKLEWL